MRYKTGITNIKVLKKRISEDFVVLLLIKAGFNIIARNFTFRYGQSGEIDIIACKDGKLVAVEVKCHKGEETPFSSRQLIRIKLGLRLFLFKYRIKVPQTEIWGALCKIRGTKIYVRFIRLT